jgi:hypothetical protein
MKYKIFIFLVCISILSVVGLILRPTNQSTNQPTNQPESVIKLLVHQEQLEFRDIFVGSTVNFRFTVTNHEQEELTVQGIASSCGFGSISPQNFTIKPQESIELKGSFEVRLYSCSITNDPKKIEYELYPILTNNTTGRKAPIWRITGNAIQVVSLQTNVINFGRQSSLKELVCPSLLIQALVPLKSVECESTDDRWGCEVSRSTSDQNTFQLKVKPFQKQLGEINFAINLWPILINGQKGSSIKINVFGEIVDDIQFEGSQAWLGLFKIGEDIEITRCLISLANSNFKILEVIPIQKDEDFEVYPTDNGTSIFLKLKVKTIGHTEKELRLKISTFNGEEVTQKLKISWYGKAN